MRIQHNIAALNTHRNLASNNAATSKSLEKLSSGFKINRAGDDAAGLAISEKMRGQIRGLDMASKNAQDGISLIQTAEGALNETHSILQRMRELAVQAGNDTNTTDDRGEIQKEINQLTSEINRIGNTTEFNTKKLVNGDLALKTQENVTSAEQTETVQYAANKDYTVGEEPVSWTGAATGAAFDIDFSGKTSGTVGTAGQLDWSTIAQAEKAEIVGGTAAGTTDNAVLFSITRNGENDFAVNASITDGTDTTTITNKALSYDVDTQTFSMDAEGVKFSFTKEEAAKWENGDTVKVDLAKAGTATTVNTDPTTASLNDVSTTDLAKVENFAVDKSKLNGLSKVVVSHDSGTEKITVDLQGAGGSLQKYEYDLVATGDKLEFNASGVKFDYTVGDDNSDFTVNLNQQDAQKVVTAEEVKATTVVSDNSLKFQIGANQNQALSVSVSDMRAAALGIVGTGPGFTSTKEVTDGTDATAVESALDLSSHETAAAAITTLDAAINAVSSERAKLGAVQNRLEHTINNLGASSENLTAAESRIRDTDMAASMMEFTKNNILTQAAQSMLAQANQQPQGVLQLLG